MVTGLPEENATNAVIRPAEIALPNKKAGNTGHLQLYPIMT